MRLYLLEQVRVLSAELEATQVVLFGTHGQKLVKLQLSDFLPIEVQLVEHRSSCAVSG